MNAYKISVKSLKGRGHSGNIGVNGRIILKWILGKMGRECVGWNYLAQGMDRWRHLVNTIMHLGVP
jgi:hypothetical protein